jgi:hypothetical protein
MQKNKWNGRLVGLSWLGAAGLVALIGLLGRFWQLARFPAGLHQDEAWFAYNAWLLLKNGANIYGERFPLTVDMWGDHVSAIHSYFLVPFIAMLGTHTAAFRTGIVVAGILAAVVVGWWLYRQTKNALLVLLMAVMVALSPWTIVMSRASSSVMIDTLVLAVLVVVFSQVVSRAAQSGLRTHADRTRLLLGMVGVYAVTIICYITYFTSRLLVPPFIVGLGLYYWWQYRWQWRSLLTGAIVTLLLAYLVFPFGYFLRTPYAMGRYQETAIIGSQTVEAALTAHIAQAGQAGLPVWATRFRYNKVTENLGAFWQQYVGLLSPSVMLFHNGPPARYEVPNGASMTIFEYVGVVLAIAALVLVRPQTQTGKSASQVITAMRTTQSDLRPLLALTLFFTLVAAVPSALTQDDFPNMQRAVIMVPWLQVLAALGWFVVLQQWFGSSDQRVGWWRKTQQVILNPFALVILVVVASAPTVLSFWYGYVAQTPYERPFHRSRAGEELARWINANAHDAKIIQEHIEGVFFYPYLFGEEDLREQVIKKPGKYFLNAEDFWIGQRHFVRDLCASPELTKEPYDYYIFFTLHNRCPKVGTMMKVFEAKYDDGSVGFTVYRPLTEQEQFLEAVSSATPSALVN